MSFGSGFHWHRLPFRYPAVQMNTGEEMRAPSLGWVAAAVAMLLAVAAYRDMTVVGVNYLGRPATTILAGALTHLNCYPC